MRLETYPHRYSGSRGLPIPSFDRHDYGVSWLRRQALADSGGLRPPKVKAGAPQFLKDRAAFPIAAGPRWTASNDSGAFIASFDW
jgi:hypothetical protein